MIVKPDGFFGVTMAIEGIADSTVLMHGPDGCRKNLGALTGKVHPRRDRTINMATPYYRGSSRIPCTDLEPSDYIYGAFDRVTDALSEIKARSPGFVAVVCSPGASLIGDDCQKAIDENGLTDIAMVLDADLSSKPINVGIDLTLRRVLERVATEDLQTEEGTVVLLGNHVLQKDWESVNEEFTEALALLGLRVICCVGAGCTVDEMRRSVRAQYAVSVCPEYSLESARFYEEHGAVTVIPDYSPVGFDATEHWIRAVAEATGRDPSLALNRLDEFKRRAYRRMLAARFDTDSFGFDIDAEPSIAYPLTRFFYDNLQMVPKRIQYNGISYGPSEALMDSFLRGRGMSEVMDAEEPEYVEILCCDGNTADMYMRSGHCLRGVDLRFPSMMNVEFIPQPVFGATGAMYLLERVINRFRGDGTMQLSIDNVEFGYSSTPVLKDVSVRLEGPKFVSILGPNGVGKSTLIHCINKILEPRGGAVMIDGRDVKDFTVKEMAKEVGYVPYSANDSFPLTVVDTVLMGRHPHAKWGSLDRDLTIVYDTLKMLGISHLAMRPFSELSAGQHQKVMLARGLVQESKILLLDEPTSNLDIRHQLDVTRMLKDLTMKKGILTIMISHDISITAKFADEIILMHNGGIYAVGTPEEVITEENLSTVYGVKARIIDDDGRPHVILKDAIPVGDEAISPQGVVPAPADEVAVCT